MKKDMTFPERFYSEQIRTPARPVHLVCSQQELEILMQHLFSVQEKSGKRFLNRFSSLLMENCQSISLQKILFLEFSVILPRTAELTELWNLTEMQFSLYLWMR